MKELIDKEETLNELRGKCGYCDRQECYVDRCNIYKILSKIPPVVCVSDDFTLKPKTEGKK